MTIQRFFESLGRLRILSRIHSRSDHILCFLCLQSVKAKLRQPAVSNGHSLSPFQFVGRFVESQAVHLQNIQVKLQIPPTDFGYFVAVKQRPDKTKLVWRQRFKLSPNGSRNRLPLPLKLFFGMKSSEIRKDSFESGLVEDTRFQKCEQNWVH